MVIKKGKKIDGLTARNILSAVAEVATEGICEIKENKVMPLAGLTNWKVVRYRFILHQ